MNGAFVHFVAIYCCCWQRATLSLSLDAGSLSLFFFIIRVYLLLEIEHRACEVPIDRVLVERLVHLLLVAPLGLPGPLDGRLVLGRVVLQQLDGRLRVLLDLLLALLL